MTDLNISVLRLMKPKILKPITTIMSSKLREDMLREKIPFKKRIYQENNSERNEHIILKSHDMTFV